jgi:hypothetical protein
LSLAGTDSSDGKLLVSCATSSISPLLLWYHSHSESPLESDEEFSQRWDEEELKSKRSKKTKFQGDDSSRKDSEYHTIPSTSTQCLFLTLMRLIASQFRIGQEDDDATAQ